MSGVVVLVVTALLIYHTPAKNGPLRYPLLFPSLLLGLYALGQPFLPFLARGAIAIMVVGTLFHIQRWGTMPPTPYWGLFLLSLPMVPSMQFFLGFPARVAAATVTVFLLQTTGLTVKRRGTVLDWGDKMIQFDAPCSGVKMLWTGFFITLVLTVHHRLGMLRTALALLICLVVVVLGNGLRGSSLFYLETGLLSAPKWWHDGVGMVVFLTLTIILIRIVEKISQW